MFFKQLIYAVNVLLPSSKVSDVVQREANKLKAGVQDIYRCHTDIFIKRHLNLCISGVGMPGRAESPTRMHRLCC